MQEVYYVVDEYIGGIFKCEHIYMRYVYCVMSNTGRFLVVGYFTLT